MISKKFVVAIFLLMTFTQAFGQETICSYVVKGGRSTGFSSDTPCPLFSVVKFPQALFVANVLEKSRRSLEDEITIRKADLMQDTWSPMLNTFTEGTRKFSVAELLRLSLQESDNNACQILFDEFGGPHKVQRFVHELGFKGISIHVSERQMMADKASSFQNTASAKEMAHLLEWFYLHKADNPNLSFVWRTMSCGNTGTSRIIAVTQPDDVVVHKTGTGFPTDNGVSAINDAGIILHPDGSHTVAVIFVLNYQGTPSDAEKSLVASLKESIAKIR